MVVPYRNGIVSNPNRLTACPSGRASIGTDALGGSVVFATEVTKFTEQFCQRCKPLWSLVQIGTYLRIAGSGENAGKSFNRVPNGPRVERHGREGRCRRG